MEDFIRNTIAAIIIGLVSYIIFASKTSTEENLEKDRTWFGPLWTTFLQQYDQQWDDAKSKLKAIDCEYVNMRLDSSSVFGHRSQTNVHICGKRTNPILLLLPGYKATSTMYAKNIPELTKKYCVITLDYPFDLGRSMPGHMKDTTEDKQLFKYTKFTPTKASVETIIKWIRVIMMQLQIKKIDALGGFSLGAYISSLIALYAHDLVVPKAPILLLAPPASFSRLKFSFVIPMLFYQIRNDLTGIPLPFHRTNVGLLKDDISKETECGTVENIDFDSLLKALKAKDLILTAGGTIPPIPFPVRQYKIEELKRMGAAYNITYVSLEFDCWYHSRIGHRRATEAGINSIFVENTTHRFPTSQPKKFHQLLLNKFVEDGVEGK